MNRAELAIAINHVARLKGEFRLRSGAVSNEYFDKYRFESDPPLMAIIAAELAALVPADVEVLAGLELGGVPIATLLSQQTGLPTAFVRKAAKSYGTARLAEGAEVGGHRVLLVEDVVTSGGQAVESATALRGLGAEIRCAVCVIDREAGGRANLSAAGIELRALFRRAELEASAA